jgi:hypothetical protein
VPVLPTPEGENVLIITVPVVPACCCRTRRRQRPVADGDAAGLDAAFRKFHPAAGAAGNLSISRRRAAITYVNTVKLGLSDERSTR